MYIQQTLLHLSNTPDVCADAKDIRRLHTRVMSLFGGNFQQVAGIRELWAHPQKDRLLIQHPVPIDLRWLPPGYATDTSTRSAPVLWEAGARVRWAVCANPTAKIASGRSEPPPDGHTSWTSYFAAQSRRYRQAGRRVPVRDDAGIRQWAARVLKGLSVDEVSIGDRRTVHGVKGEHRVSIFRAVLSGTGVVTCPDEWRLVLTAGVGHGRAYGCGLVVCEAQG